MATVQTVGVTQTQEKVLVTFPVPYKGVMRNASEVEIPRDALWTGENLHFVEGELRQRPSWNLARNATVAAPPATAPITAVWTSRRAGTRNQFLFVGGVADLYVLGSAGWVKIGNWGGTRGRYQLVRATEIALGTPLVTHVLAVNGVDFPLDITIPAASNPVLGDTISQTSAPKWRDICTASDRIVGITDTEVQWGEILRLDVWPALNVKSLAETLDFCVAIRPLSTLNTGIWKERSFWVGQAAGGSSASYFRWKLLKWVEGPASASALTHDSKGNWYWMTKTGRIVKMDNGYNITYPGDGVWPIVRKQMSPLFTEYSDCHAVYRPFYDEVWFFYGGLPDQAGT